MPPATGTVTTAPTGEQVVESTDSQRRRARRRGGPGRPDRLCESPSSPTRRAERGSAHPPHRGRRLPLAVTAGRGPGPRRRRRDGLPPRRRTRRPPGRSSPHSSSRRPAPRDAGRQHRRAVQGVRRRGRLPGERDPVRRSALARTRGLFAPGVVGGGDRAPVRAEAVLSGTVSGAQRRHNERFGGDSGSRRRHPGDPGRPRRRPRPGRPSRRRRARSARRRRGWWAGSADVRPAGRTRR